MVFPSSTIKGEAITSFPDVCKTPAPPGAAPVPIPYPNLATKTASPVQKVGVKTGATGAPSKMAGARGNEAGVQLGIARAQYRSKLDALHAQMMGLPPGNPNQWHRLLDEYVIMVAGCYKTISNSPGAHNNPGGTQMAPSQTKILSG